MIFKITVNFFGKWISKTPLCSPANIILDASLGEIIKGIGKLFFFVKRVSTNPGQTNEISIINGLNSTNADSATLFNADFVGP